MDKEISGGGGSGGRWPWSMQAPVVRELGPPAFLTKTYTIVDDPNTDSIVSWGQLGNSFIIWDHIKFTADILPKYFRHNNLSSFVYQLNNYGFRKIGCDHQWEYQNQDFQKGKLHLLSNMKRRGQNPARKRAHYDLKELHKSELEIKKLKSQQAEMELQIIAMKDEVKNAEIKMKKMMACFAKACDRIIAEKTIEETRKENDTPEKNSGECAYWKNVCILLEDDDGVAYEGAMANEQVKIARDLHDLITMKQPEEVATTAD